MIMCASACVCVCIDLWCVQYLGVCECVCACMNMCLRERHLSVMSACQQCNVTITTLGDIEVAI